MDFYTIVKTGFFVVTSQVIPPKHKHVFCGKHNIKGANCPNCKKPLLRFLTIDTTDPTLPEFNFSIDKIHILFCWTCNLSQTIFYYRLNSSKIEIISYGKGGKQKEFPYSNYPKFFPEKDVALKEITNHEQSIIKGINSSELDEFELPEIETELCIPRHQIGGEPYLVHGEVANLICPLCKKEMPFLCSIGDDSFQKIGFVNNAYVQVVFYLCLACSVIGALQHAD